MQVAKVYIVVIRMSRKRSLPSWMGGSSPEVSLVSEAAQQRYCPAAYEGSAKSSEDSSPEAKRQKAEALIPPSGPIISVAEILTSRLVVFDLETTGFGTSDQIVEIGAVEIRNGRRTGLLFHSLVGALEASHPAAQAVHLITPQMVAQAPPAAEVCVLRVSSLVVFSFSFFFFSFLEKGLFFTKNTLLCQQMLVLRCMPYIRFQG